MTIPLKLGEKRLSVLSNTRPEKTALFDDRP
jgi:hypothetical protein